MEIYLERKRELLATPMEEEGRGEP